MAVINRLAINIKQARDQFIEHNNSALNVHDHLKHLSIPELQALTQAHTHPFWVCCLNVLSDMNISTVIRSAHLMGAERVVVFGRRKIDNRGLVGAANYTPVDKVWGINCNAQLNADQFRTYCKQNKVTPLFVEQGGVNVYEFDWRSQIDAILHQGHTPMLTLGTENSGIPDSILNMVPELGAHMVSIPQKGVIRSHNLSMAFAMVAGCMVKDMGWY